MGTVQKEIEGEAKTLNEPNKKGNAKTKQRNKTGDDENGPAAKKQSVLSKQSLELVQEVYQRPFLLHLDT